jgi:hypothetical protein
MPHLFSWKVKIEYDRRTIEITINATGPSSARLTFFYTPGIAWRCLLGADTNSPTQPG